MRYIIKSNKRVKNFEPFAFYEMHLAASVTEPRIPQFCLASYTGAITFGSPRQAARYAKDNKIVENRPTLGSETMPWIEGPRGGRYSIFTGRILR